MKAVEQHSVKLILNCQRVSECVIEQRYIEKHHPTVQLLPWNPNTYVEKQIPDMKIVDVVSEWIIKGENVMLHCNSGQYMSAVQACKLLMVFHGCGWKRAALMLKSQRPFVCIDVSRESSGSSLIPWELLMYNAGDTLDMTMRREFWSHLCSSVT